MYHGIDTQTSTSNLYPSCVVVENTQVRSRYCLTRNSSNFSGFVAAYDLITTNQGTKFLDRCPSCLQISTQRKVVYDFSYVPKLSMQPF